MLTSFKSRERVTQKEKNANDKQWYRDKVDLFTARAFSNLTGHNDISEYKRKKVNYDLFNNILNLRDFEYVCQPYGSKIGELPANMTNRDILSAKIKVLHGMELRRPFGWKIVAVNEEATTRKEQEQFNRMKEFVEAEIMRPIRQQIEAQRAANISGQQLSPEQMRQIQAQIEQETKAKTPDEVLKYMAREHQDPAEVMASQIMEYLFKKLSLVNKFNKGWKHVTLSGEEIYWVGILNGDPVAKVINPLYFDYERSPDIDYIEEAEWAVCEYRMTPSQIVGQFGDELTDEQIDDLYERYPYGAASIIDADFTFDGQNGTDGYTIPVYHVEWKGLRKIGFLKYYNEIGLEREMLVDENYKFNEDNGDIEIKWEWIPERHEGYKIAHDIYVYMRPVFGQHKDLDNLYECKLSYHGASYDNLNSQVTSVMDRVKAYQYFYNILFYRIELLMASDKGKKIFMNIHAIPKSMGIDIDKWFYYRDATDTIFFNPSEEGLKNTGQLDANTLARDVDMSLVSQINNYIQLAEYIEQRAGAAIGVPKQMEGSIAPQEAVTNTKQIILQSSNILEPYFEMHNIVKGNVLQSLIEVAKVAYATGQPKKLNYVLDDLSLRMIQIDQELLDNSTYGLFVSNSSKAFEVKQTIEQLAHAAVQNQIIDLSDVVKLLRTESVQEAEEMLEVSEDKKANRVQQQQIAIEQMKAEEAEKERQFKREEWDREDQRVIIKEEERRKTEIPKQAMLSLGFNENKDADSDGQPDVLELAKQGLDADIKGRKQTLDEEKFEHDKKVDKEKIELEKKKIAQQKNKPKK